MITLHGVSKVYGAQTVVAPIDWSLQPGQTHVLIGPSGCGKSTLLRMMIGLVTPTTGEIRYAGQPVPPSGWKGIRRRMGYVLQDGGLFPHLTARGNVVLMARQLGWSAERRRQRLAELTDLTRFPQEGLNRYPTQLSGGQQQRVGIMRALFLDPEVILLDEPLGALDPLIRYNLQSDLKEIFQNLGKTVVLVTHDVGEARYFGDEITLLRRGRVIQRGSFIDFVESPRDQFVTEFLTAQRASIEPGIEAFR